MVIKCGICNNEIPSHMVQERRGSHYSEYYEDVECILHQDPGKVLHVQYTEDLKSKIGELRAKEESVLVKRFIQEHGIITKRVMSLKDIDTLIANLEVVKRDIKNNSARIISEPVGRHKLSSWGVYVFISDVDICRKCIEIIDLPKSSEISLSLLNEAIPALKLSELNNGIWDEVKNEYVAFSLQSG